MYFFTYIFSYSTYIAHKRIFVFVGKFDQNMLKIATILAHMQSYIVHICIVAHLRNGIVPLFFNSACVVSYNAYAWFCTLMA